MGPIVIFGLVAASIGLVEYILSLYQSYKRIAERAKEVMELKELIERAVKHCSTVGKAVEGDNVDEVSKTDVMKKISAVGASANRVHDILGRLEQLGKVDSFIRWVIFREASADTLRTRIYEQLSELDSALLVMDIRETNETRQSVKTVVERQKSIEDSHEALKGEIRALRHHVQAYEATFDRTTPSVLRTKSSRW
jgi:uncharacterized protein Yka (UPF0111/DUF47 family)